MAIISKIKQAFTHWQERRRQPLRLEFVVTDHCNLNCVGCTHYSPLAPKEFEDLDSMTAVMKHLGEVTRRSSTPLESVYLIGGETLLYPRLAEAVRAMRKHFPEQKLYVFTNGLALPRMSEEFWAAATDCKAIIALTEYPIKFDYAPVHRLCRDKGVELEVFAVRDSSNFFRFALDPAKGQNARLSHFKCYNHGCVSVVGNKVYPCSISACVGHLNAAHGTRFEHKDGDWLWASDISDLKQIKELRDRPVPFCSYCKQPPSTVPYGPSRREKKEWTD